MLFNWSFDRLFRSLLQYCYTEAELKAATAQLAPGSYHVQRFKVG